MHYESSAWICAASALGRLRLGRDDVVIDVGCGKGTVLLLAGRYPVRRVVGVELTPDLAQIARRNVEVARDKLRAYEIQVVNRDVLEWSVPDDVTVIYAYNPFIGEVFHEVIDRVRASYYRNPRPLRILYNHPWEHDWLVSQPDVRTVDVVPGYWPPRPRWWLQPEVVVTYAVGTVTARRPGLIRARRQALEHWAAPNETRFRLGRIGRPDIWSGPPVPADAHCTD